VVRPVIQDRMSQYAGSEIRFNLMAVIRDRRAVLREELAAAERDLAAAVAGGAVRAVKHLRRRSRRRV